MASASVGSASAVLNQNRRDIMINSGLSCSTWTVRASSAMPHLGQCPG